MHPNEHINHRDFRSMTPVTPADTVTDRFSALRPYQDDEVASVLSRLSHDDEFQAAIARFRLPRLDAVAPWLTRALIGYGLRRRMRGIHSITEFQRHIADYMEHMIERTVDGLEIHGLEALDGNQAYLFIGNHRDISLDPAFVNFALYLHNRNTVRIAIGDNLLEKPYVSDLMRLNKSFIVPRSSTGKREMIKAFQLLSEYIQHSIEIDNHSVWMAQRQGRAKNGIDRTDPAIIKMLCMAKRAENRDAPLAQIIAGLHVVPVSISYEYDPCDVQKARELAATESDGSYQKLAFEDMRSIAAGIVGDKGRVNLRFGTALNGGDFDSVEALTEEIDRQVLEGYRLYPSHFLALEKLGEHPELLELDDVTSADRARFEARLAEVPKELRPWWLRQYANPVINCRAPMLLDA